MDVKKKELFVTKKNCMSSNKKISQKTKRINIKSKLIIETRRKNAKRKTVQKSNEHR